MRTKHSAISTALEKWGLNGLFSVFVSRNLTFSRSLHPFSLFIEKIAAKIVKRLPRQDVKHKNKIIKKKKVPYENVDIDAIVNELIELDKLEASQKKGKKVRTKDKPKTQKKSSSRSDKPLGQRPTWESGLKSNEQNKHRIKYQNNFNKHQLKSKGRKPK